MGVSGPVDDLEDGVRSDTDNDETHQLATLLNCSNKFLGRKVMIVYFEVITWLVG